MTSAHHHCPAPMAALSNSHFAAKPPEGGTPISDRPARPKVSNVTGMARPAPPMPSIRSCPKRAAMMPAARNIAALAKAWETAWITPPVQALAAISPAPGTAASSGNIRNR